jgi:2-keto-4-pentenoate hydratase
MSDTSLRFVRAGVPTTGGAGAHDALLRRLADELLEATRTRVPVPPLRDRVLDMTLQDAYVVQTHQLDTHRAAGRTLAGHKVGLTSFAMQRQLGVDSPDFGYFFEDMVHGEGAVLPVDGFVSPKVEPELGLVLRETLTGPGVTLERARAAVGQVFPAIEIIDSRVADWDIALVDTVADNASCGAIAVGSTPLDVPVEDLIEVLCGLRINGELRESGTGADVMDDPVAPLAWLANVLGERGVSLEAGQLVLTGSFTRAVPVVAGESVTADYGPHGSLTISFAQPGTTTHGRTQ